MILLVTVVSHIVACAVPTTDVKTFVVGFCGRVMCHVSYFMCRCWYRDSKLSQLLHGGTYHVPCCGS